MPELHTKSLEKLTLKLMEKNGVIFDSETQDSVKCQFEQIENIVRDTITEMKAEIITEMQASHDSDMFNAFADGSQPLIDLDSAKCAVDEYLT